MLTEAYNQLILFNYFEKFQISIIIIDEEKDILKRIQTFKKARIRNMF
jgi:hypothetical protein